jgi:hypothetical protein
MKTEILSKAIKNRNKIKLYYAMKNLIIDPYILSIDKDGKKIMYGKVNDSDTVLKFEFKRIYNIRVLEDESFAPRILNIPRYH